MMCGLTFFTIHRGVLNHMGVPDKSSSLIGKRIEQLRGFVNCEPLFSFRYYSAGGESLLTNCVRKSE